MTYRDAPFRDHPSLFPPRGSVQNYLESFTTSSGFPSSANNSAASSSSDPAKFNGNFAVEVAEIRFNTRVKRLVRIANAKEQRHGEGSRWRLTSTPAEEPGKEDSAAALNGAQDRVEDVEGGEKVEEFDHVVVGTFPHMTRIWCSVTKASFSASGRKRTV
jgi:hypothetical protein